MADSDEISARMMMLACRSALRGFGRVEPNPMVGAVLVRHWVGAGRGVQILGIGHHRRFGDLHAETEAIEACRRKGEDPRGATLYVTLEPCNHFGKQPPCSDAVLRAGISRVVVAYADANHEASGGAGRLRGAGVKVEFLSAAESAAVGVGGPFLKRIATGLPWVIAKWAQTPDGRLSTEPGAERWITGEPARRRVHRLRGMVDAVMTGIGTVLVDDPLLTARGVKVRRTAARVVVDSELRLPSGSKLAQSAGAGRVLAMYATGRWDGTRESHRAELEALGVVCRPQPTDPATEGVELELMLRHMAQHEGVSTVLLEAGPTLLGSMFAAGLVDVAVAHVAKTNDLDAARASAAVVVAELSDARRWSVLRRKRVGADAEVVFTRAAVQARR